MSTRLVFGYRVLVCKYSSIIRVSCEYLNNSRLTQTRVEFFKSLAQMERRRKEWLRNPLHLVAAVNVQPLANSGEQEIQKADSVGGVGDWGEREGEGKLVFRSISPTSFHPRWDGGTAAAAACFCFNQLHRGWLGPLPPVPAPRAQSRDLGMDITAGTFVFGHDSSFKGSWIEQ